MEEASRAESVPHHPIDTQTAMDPVIMLTANGQPESMTQPTNLGATEYVKKLFSSDRLLKTIELFFPR